jgi:hypothetical protein
MILMIRVDITGRCEGVGMLKAHDSTSSLCLYYSEKKGE